MCATDQPGVVGVAERLPYNPGQPERDTALVGARDLGRNEQGCCRREAKSSDM